MQMRVLKGLRIHAASAVHRIVRGAAAVLFFVLRRSRSSGGGELGFRVKVVVAEPSSPKAYTVMP